MSDKFTKQPKRKTSENIIDRIKWDTNFDKDQLIIGYLDRFDGMQEIDLEGFEASDIVYHRIYYLKYKNKIVWDRKNNIDLITGQDASKWNEEEKIKEEPKHEKKKKKKKNTKPILNVHDDYGLDDDYDNF